MTNTIFESNIDDTLLQIDFDYGVAVIAARSCLLLAASQTDCDAAETS
jgi:hypothetical protein